MDKWGFLRMLVIFNVCACLFYAFSFIDFEWYKLIDEIYK